MVFLRAVLFRPAAVGRVTPDGGPVDLHGIETRKGGRVLVSSLALKTMDTSPF